MLCYVRKRLERTPGPIPGIERFDKTQADFNFEPAASLPKDGCDWMSPYSSVQRDRTVSLLGKPNANTGDDHAETLVGISFGDSGALYAKHNQRENDGWLGASVPLKDAFQP